MAPTQRPRILVSVVSSADGRIAPNRKQILLDPGGGEIFGSIGTPGVDRLVQSVSDELRERFGHYAVLEGSGSFVLDEAGPANFPAETHSEGLYFDYLPPELKPTSWFVVVDSRGRVPWHMKGSQDRHLLVLVSQTTPSGYLAFLSREGIPYLVVGEDRVDLRVAVLRLKEVLGVETVCSTAGGGLNGALLRADLVDEFYLVLKPGLIGGLGTPSTFDGPPLPPGDLPTTLRLNSSKTSDDGAVLLHYEVVH